MSVAAHGEAAGPRLLDAARPEKQPCALPRCLARRFCCSRGSPSASTSSKVWTGQAPTDAQERQQSPILQARQPQTSDHLANAIHSEPSEGSNIYGKHAQQATLECLFIPLTRITPSGGDSTPERSLLPSKATCMYSVSRQGNRTILLLLLATKSVLHICKVALLAQKGLADKGDMLTQGAAVRRCCEPLGGRRPAATGQAVWRTLAEQGPPRLRSLGCKGLRLQQQALT